MKKITKVILLICMIAMAENAFAQWSFSMSFSYVGRDCGFMPELHSIEARANQMLKTSQVQYPTRDQCLAERSMVQSIFNELINTYSYGLADCRIVFSLGGCTGSDMGSNTIQLGVSKDAVFQSSNPANEVNDWIAMQDSLLAIFGNPYKYEEPLDQTAHIQDFIGGLDQIEHVNTPQETFFSKPEERVIPDNFKLATDHEAPSFDWDNVYNYKEEIVIAKPLPKPILHWEDNSDYEPVHYDVEGEGPDVEDWVDAIGDVAKSAVDITMGFGLLATGIATTTATGTVMAGVALGIGFDFAINLLVEDTKVFIKGVWKGEPVTESTMDIVGNAAKKTVVGNLLDHTAATPDAGGVIETCYHTASGVAMGALAEMPVKKNPIGSLLSIGTRTVKYVGKVISGSWE